MFRLTIKSNKSLPYFDSKYWIFGQENQLFFLFRSKKKKKRAISRCQMNFLIVAIFDSSSFLLLRWLLNLSWWEISASWNISGANCLPVLWILLSFSSPKQPSIFSTAVLLHLVKEIALQWQKEKKAQHFFTKYSILSHCTSSTRQQSLRLSGWFGGFFFL